MTEMDRTRSLLLCSAILETCKKLERDFAELRRLTEEAITEATTAQVSPNNSAEPVARISDPLCPRAMGNPLKPRRSTMKIVPVPASSRDQDRVRTGGESPSFGPTVMPRGNR